MRKFNESIFKQYLIHEMNIDDFTKEQNTILNNLIDFLNNNDDEIIILETEMRVGKSILLRAINNLLNKYSEIKSTYVVSKSLKSIDTKSILELLPESDLYIFDDLLKCDFEDNDIKYNCGISDHIKKIKGKKIILQTRFSDDDYISLLEKIYGIKTIKINIDIKSERIKSLRTENKLLKRNLQNLENIDKFLKQNENNIKLTIELNKF